MDNSFAKRFGLEICSCCGKPKRQGDSRNLVEVLDGARAEGIISSPPWQHSEGSMSAEFMKWKNAQIQAGKMGGEPCRGQPTAQDGYGTSPAQLGNMPTGEPPSAIVSSPPFSPDQPCASQTQGLKDYHAFTRGDGTKRDHVMRSEGQLGTIPTGEPPQAVISSPPYGDITNIGERRDPNKSIEAERRYRANHPELEGIRPKALEPYGDSPGQLGAMRMGEPPQAIIGSPPHSVNVKRDHTCEQRDKGKQGKGCFRGTYGSKADGQLAAMREGDVDAVIASPPWQKSLDRGTVPKEARVKQARDMGLSADKVSPIDMENIGLRTQPDYGTTDGQLAALPEGEPPAGIVSSPPYEEGLGHGMTKVRDIDVKKGLVSLAQSNYGGSEGNIGHMVADTFWSAARAILLQCHAVLAPGGVAIFVTKRFVRDKAIVEFSQQWADLCQSCGLELIEWIKAWLVEERGTQYDLTGKAHTKTVKRFSFFRRLHAQKYPHLAIEWEDVLIFRKSAKERRGNS